MDFIMGLSLASSKKSAVWAHVDRPTKSINFVPTHGMQGVERLL